MSDNESGEAPSDPTTQPGGRFKKGNAGRKPGSQNKRVVKIVPAEQRARLLKARKLVADEANGETPLQFALKVMRGEKIMQPNPDGGPPIEVIPNFADMKWACQVAMPYMHPSFRSIEHSGTVKHTHEDFLSQLSRDDIVIDAAVEPRH